MFQCNKCGCCRNLNKSILYAGLDRGDGVCKYLDGNLCSIYEERPILCRIDECYELYFKQIIDKKKYYNLNKEMCENLRKTEG